MNILFLTREYKHEKLPSCGGTGNYYSNLSKQLQKEGHTVSVFGIGKKNIEINDNGILIKFEKNLFKKNKFYNLIRSVTGKFAFLNRCHFAIHRYEKKNIAKQLQKFIKKNNLIIDIIETHDFEGISLFLGNKIPYTIRCHGSFSVFDKYYGFKADKSKLYCENEAFKIAKNIIVVSEYSKIINYELFGKNNMKLIYNGIDTNKFTIDKSVSILTKSIFHFGNTSIEKGAEISLSVFIKIQKSIPEATLHFLGVETEYKKKLLVIIEKNQLHDKVIFHGFQHTNQAIKILSTADIVLFPSKGETFGLALCEAMSLFKTVIASNIPSFNEIITHGYNGYLANTIEEYCSCIVNLFDDKEKAEIIKNNARNSIIERFSQSKMIEETLNYYKNVIEENN